MSRKMVTMKLPIKLTTKPDILLCESLRNPYSVAT